MKRQIIVLAGISSIVLLWGSQADAQSDDEPSPRDLSGVWLLDGSTAAFSAEPPPPMTAWGAQRFAANRPTVGDGAVLDGNDPTLDCLPPGLPYVLTIPTPFEIVQVDGQILQVFEYDHSLRRIHTDGRQWPDDLELTGMYEWMGYSIGRWEDGALVVETRGFNDRSWLDRSGRPHSEQLRVVERLYRADSDTLIDEISIYDPRTYTAPWHGRLVFKLKTGWEIFEHICITGETVGAGYREYVEQAWEPVD